MDKKVWGYQKYSDQPNNYHICELDRVPDVLAGHLFAPPLESFILSGHDQVYDSALQSSKVVRALGQDQNLADSGPAPNLASTKASFFIFCYNNRQ
ncbi:hypothetical protein ACFL6I_29220 [candidate division KSB1 bacterium]